MLKQFYGSQGSHAIFWGAFFGFAMGMLPTFNLLFFVLLALILCGNTYLPMALLSFLIGKGACFLFAPITFQLGYFLIHYMGLGSLVRFASETPLLALLDLQVYCLMGGIPLILTIGLLYSYLAAKAFAKEESSFPVNPLRTQLGFLFVALALFIQSFYIGGYVQRNLIQILERVNKAEVNIDKVSVNLYTSGITVHKLQITNPKRPERNKIEAPEISGTISVFSLLAKQLVFDEVFAEKMIMDVRRKTPGRVYKNLPEQEAKLNLRVPKFEESSKYLDAVKELDKDLDDLEDTLAAEEDRNDQGPPPSKELKRYTEKTRDLLKLSAKPFLAQKPVWVIRSLLVKNFKIKPDFPGIELEAKNVSSHPRRHSKKMHMKAKPNKQTLKDLEQGVKKTGRSLLDHVLGK